MEYPGNNQQGKEQPFQQMEANQRGPNSIFLTSLEAAPLVGSEFSETPHFPTKKERGKERAPIAGGPRQRAPKKARAWGVKSLATGVSSHSRRARWRRSRSSSFGAGEKNGRAEGLRLGVSQNLAGFRTPANNNIFCLVSGKQREPQKSKKGS